MEKDKEMSKDKFRCGYCGHPTDENGFPLEFDEDIHIIEKDYKKEGMEVKLVHGKCYHEEQHERYITVTRDMAIDAGDLSLEGEQWLWLK
jgi:hypothetical protein